jgi:hypothetical protein
LFVDPPESSAVHDHELHVRAARQREREFALHTSDAVSGTSADGVSDVEEKGHEGLCARPRTNAKVPMDSSDEAWHIGTTPPAARERVHVGWVTFGVGLMVSRAARPAKCQYALARDLS